MRPAPLPLKPVALTVPAKVGLPLSIATLAESAVSGTVPPASAEALSEVMPEPSPEMTPGPETVTFPEVANDAPVTAPPAVRLAALTAPLNVTLSAASDGTSGPARTPPT